MYSSVLESAACVGLLQSSCVPGGSCNFYQVGRQPAESRKNPLDARSTEPLAVAIVVDVFGWYDDDDGVNNLQASTDSTVTISNVDHGVIVYIT